MRPFTAYEGEFETSGGTSVVSPPQSERASVARAIGSGNRDETSLTNAVFFARHPERSGAAIKMEEPGGPALAREWIGIRDTIVKPLLRASTSMGTPYTPVVTAVVGPVLRGNAAAHALAELTRWDYGRIKEGDQRMQATLRDYWVTGTGSDYGFREKKFWSAAFISWVMKKAGAGKNFAYSSAHGTYIAAARANTYAGNANPFKAYPPLQVAPRVGDIVCRRYKAGISTDFDKIGGTGYHGDIVTSISNGIATVVGGNVQQSVAARKCKLAPDGKLLGTDAVYVAIVRVA
ncbi:MAG TPA: DUF2272 domain-containing protein [Phycisphaerales bacterium]|nr:DUF2272 domain-containing protein [Phycisphaerales bacterium]